MFFRLDTVHLCGSRGCKTNGNQIWRSEKNLRFLIKPHILQCLRGRAHKFSIFFPTSNLNLLQFCSSLGPTNAQYLICKPWQFLNGIVSSQNHSSNFKIWYLHLKYPHLCSAYLVGTPYWIFYNCMFISFSRMYGKIQKIW